MNQNNSTTAVKKPLAAIMRDASALLYPTQEIAIADAGDTSRKATEARYMVMELMEKAGYNHTEIGGYFKIGRDSVCKALAKLDTWKVAYKDIRATCVRLEAHALNNL